MRLRFELPSKIRQSDAIDYIDEFVKHKSTINGTGGLNVNNYDNWLHRVLHSHQGIEERKDRVPASTYFVIDENNTLVGMVNVRHYLNEYLYTSGSGHVGYSVRPTERRKGYATRILKESLSLLKMNFNVKEALVGCYKDNIGSRKTIENNGGILLREIKEENNKITLAFSIKLLG